MGHAGGGGIRDTRRTSFLTVNDDDRLGCRDSVRLSPATVVDQWLGHVLTVGSWSAAWDLMTDDLRLQCVRLWVASTMQAAGLVWVPRPDEAVDAMARQLGPTHRDWPRFARWWIGQARADFGPVEQLGTCPAEVPVDPAHERVTVVRMEPTPGGGAVLLREWAVMVRHTDQGPRIASFRELPETRPVEG